MTTITLVCVIGILLLDFAGAIPRASVGGPLALFLILFLGMLAVGFHEAWSNRRGVLGWIVSIDCSVIGGFLAVVFAGPAMETLLPLLEQNASPATPQHPVRYAALAGMMALTLLGSWTTIQVANRVR
jgi:hypothetical protein